MAVNSSCCWELTCIVLVSALYMVTADPTTPVTSPALAGRMRVLLCLARCWKASMYDWAVAKEAALRPVNDRHGNE